MSDLFHVFIERPRSDAPDAMGALARAIGERYGIPAAEVQSRLASGRFRVKGNVDRAMADSYVDDLTRLGAVCTLVPATAAAPVAPVAPPPVVAPPMSLPRVERAPVPVARPSAPQDLGALSGEFPLTLSTLDGASEDEARASRNLKLPASFGPPDAAAERLPASFGPATSAGPAPVLRDVNGGGDAVSAAGDGGAGVEVFDPFAPPESQSNAPELTLAVDRPSRRAPTQAEEPVATQGAYGAPVGPAPAMPASPAASLSSLSSSSLPERHVGPAGPAGDGWRGLLRNDVTRLIAGAVLAVALGAAPALLIGGARERAAFAEIDTELGKRQDAAQTREAWDGLDRVRASFVERKQAERQSIAITSLLIWAVIGGGVAWLWFRTIDWDRVLAGPR